jgi:hypothetical protein
MVDIEFWEAQTPSHASGFVQEEKSDLQCILYTTTIFFQVIKVPLDVDKQMLMRQTNK